MDAKGEVMLTILSSLSQEESKSISENVRWGQRKKFSDGRFSMPYSSFLGYDKGPDGTLVINEEQAKLVRRIFKMYLQGLSTKKIAQTLTEEGIKTVRGKDVWNPASINGVLRNEKYKGDALLQKTYTKDFLSKKRKTNRGELLENLRYVQEEIGKTEELDEEEVRLTNELIVITGLMEDAINRNARVAQNQENYQKAFDDLTERYETTKARLEKVQEAAHGKKSRGRKIGMFIAAVENLPDKITEFNDVTWTYMVDHVTVYAKNDIRFTLNSVEEIKA